MTTITVPPELGDLPRTDASATSASFGRGLRSAATAISDVGDWARTNGRPTSWTGIASDAAGTAMTKFAGDTDVTVAALTRAAAAADRFTERLDELLLELRDLGHAKSDYNRDQLDLWARVDGAPEDQFEGLRDEAVTLTRRHTRLVERIEKWADDVRHNEDRLIAALQRVDTVAEAESAATAPGQPDLDRLQRELARRSKDPREAKRWWDSLTDLERQALIVAHPELVGQTNGLPTGARDEANRAMLDRDLATLAQVEADGELTDEQRVLLDKAQQTRLALERAETEIDRSTGQPIDANLLLYVPGAFGGDGAVAVAYGDPDTADDTAVIVPGIMNQMNSINGNAESAMELFLQSQAGRDGSVATIAWVGYDAPNIDMPTGPVNTAEEVLDIGLVSREDKAIAGGHLLSDFVDGLRASDEGPQSHLTVIGHSYGSTTTAHAAHDDGLAADDVVLVGSPGAGGGATTAADLGTHSGNVWVGSSDQDPVSWLGNRDHDLGMGRDPANVDFGARRFYVEPGAPMALSVEGAQNGLANHTAYFDKGSDSLVNLSNIVTDRDSAVHLVPGRTETGEDIVRREVAEEVVRRADEVHDRYVAPVIDTADRVATGVVDGVVDTATGTVEVVESTVDRWQRLQRFLSAPPPSFGDLF